MPDNSRRTHDGKWRKGVSGNPSGPQSGYRHKATLIAQQLLDGRSDELVEKAIAMALTGDGAALKLCMDRLLPAKKETPVTVALPCLTSAKGAAEAIAALADAVATGMLTPSEGQAIGSLVGKYVEAREIEQMAARIEALEQELKARS